MMFLSGLLDIPLRVVSFCEMFSIYSYIISFSWSLFLVPNFLRIHVSQRMKAGSYWKLTCIHADMLLLKNFKLSPRSLCTCMILVILNKNFLLWLILPLYFIWKQLINPKQCDKISLTLVYDALWIIHDYLFSKNRISPNIWGQFVMM